MIKINAKILVKSLLCIIFIGSMVACSKKTTEAMVEPIEVSKAVAAAPVAVKAFPQNGKIDYRGLYVLPTIDKGTMNTEVKAYYDKWKKLYVKKVTNANEYIIDMAEKDYTKINQIKTTSEAMGYGMVITAYMAGYDSNAKAQFDGLYAVAKKFPSAAHNNLMAWWVIGNKDGDTGVSGLKIPTVQADGKPIPSTDNPRYSATDGDMDIAYALLLADKQWGSTGAINYKADAVARIKAIFAKDVHPTEFILKIGDQQSNNDTHTRPSDFMPGHLKAFMAVDTANAAGWQKVIDRIYSIVDSYTSYGELSTGKKGLLPDFLVKENDKWVAVPGKFIEDEHDGDYNYNSCRTPWRLGTAIITNPDKPYETHYPVAKGRYFILNLNQFVETQGGIAKFKAGYYIGGTEDGTSWVDYEDTSFTSPLGVAAMIHNWGPYTDPAKFTTPAKLRATTAWNINKVFDSEWGDYFSHSINMQVLLVMSGNWWTPQY